MPKCVSGEQFIISADVGLINGHIKATLTSRSYQCVPGHPGPGAGEASSMFDRNGGLQSQCTPIPANGSEVSTDLSWDLLCG